VTIVELGAGATVHAIYGKPIVNQVPSPKRRYFGLAAFVADHKPLERRESGSCANVEVTRNDAGEVVTRDWKGDASLFLVTSIRLISSSASSRVSATKGSSRRAPANCRGDRRSDGCLHTVPSVSRVLCLSEPAVLVHQQIDVSDHCSTSRRPSQTELDGRPGPRE
jgi:hypothetical protein